MSFLAQWGALFSDHENFWPRTQEAETKINRTAGTERESCSLRDHYTKRKKSYAKLEIRGAVSNGFGGCAANEAR
jgi:hypothetical protein